MNIIRQMPSSHRRAAVIGATGHTGRFVMAELMRRGIIPIAVARNADALTATGWAEQNVATYVAATDNAAALDAALAKADLVINCAGPFLDTADAVVTAALRRGIPYLDITAEQACAQAVLDRYDGPARQAKTLILPAMGFYGGLGDLLVTAAMGDWKQADAAWISIALDSWHPTVGTRLTGLRNTAPRFVIQDNRLVPLSTLQTEATGAPYWDFSPPFGNQPVTELPFSETPLIARHLRVGRLRNYLNMAPLRDIRDPSTPPPRLSEQTGRSTQQFQVEVIVQHDGNNRRIMVQGHDIYAFSAPFVCEAAARILDGQVQSSGAYAPGAVFDAADYLRALAGVFLNMEM